MYAFKALFCKHHIEDQVFRPLGVDEASLEIPSAHEGHLPAEALSQGQVSLCKAAAESWWQVWEEVGIELAFLGAACFFIHCHGFSPSSSC